MTEKPTAGPWQTSGNTYSDVVEIWSSKPSGRKAFLLADVHQDMGDEPATPDPAKANADLIVAACNACHEINPDDPIGVARGLVHTVGTIQAVVHQLMAGEASDLIEGVPTSTELFASQRDLKWCREQLRNALDLLQGHLEPVTGTDPRD